MSLVDDLKALTHTLAHVDGLRRELLNEMRVYPPNLDECPYKKGEIIHLANGRFYELSHVNIVEVQTGYHDYLYQWEAHYQNQNAPYDMVVYKKGL